MKNSKKTLLASLLVSSLTFTSAMAQENVLNSDPININGYVSEEESAVDAELQNVENELRKQQKSIVINKKKKKKYNELSRSTEKLADVTEDMIVERKESQETIDRYNKKIDCLMAEDYKEGCEEFVKKPLARRHHQQEDVVQVQQAAPVQTQAEVVAPVDKNEFGGLIKVLPYTGITSINSSNEDFEAGLVGGFRIETNVSSNFSVGVGFNYTSLETNDFASNFNYNSYDYGYYYQSAYDGREMKYSNMNFNIYGKYFFVTNRRFRPYVGAGLGYNRSSIEYTDNTNNYYSNYGFGDEEVNSSGINMEMLVGSEIKFSEAVGMNLEFSYQRRLGGNISSNNRSNYYDFYYYPDQDRLEDLSEELAEANIMSIFAGLLVEF